MPLSSYAEVQDAVADFLNRSDLTAQVPTFIALAEAQMQRDVRHWRMHDRVTADLTGRYLAIPQDWVETIRLTVSGQYDLRLVSTAWMQAKRAVSDDAGRPGYFAHVAGEIEVWPRPGEAYDAELFYVARIPALSDVTPSNWLLNEAPDVYLYGSLVASAPFLQEDARLAVWAGLYAGSVQKLNAAGEAAVWSGRGLVMR